MRRGDYHEGMDRVLTVSGLSERPPGKNVNDSPCAAYPERDQIRQSASDAVMPTPRRQRTGLNGFGPKNNRPETKGEKTRPDSGESS